MTVTRRNFMWPLIIIALGSLWLLMVAGAFPDVVEDVLFRAWPALVVLFGFDVLFGRRQIRISRLSLDTSLIGLVVTLVMVAAVVFFAYRKQADVVRTDNQQTFSKVLPTSVERVRLLVDLERTAVTVVSAAEHERELAVIFKGSNESDVEMTWELIDQDGTLTITEDYRNALPRLEDYGRGTLEITLPIGVVVEQFDLTVASGAVSLDFAAVNVPSLALDVPSGNVLLALPVNDVLDGDLVVGGDLELLVPANTTINVKAQGSSAPTFDFDRDRYDLLVGGELKNKAIDSFQYSLDVWMNGGATLTITDLE
ncbi:MAG: hypothetical protein K8S97_11345 [Anaerolineae bacterium]|nr:hypothetical protein [Anaerolineae bacterium]